MNKTVSLSFRIVTAVLFAVPAAQAGAQSTAPSPLANPAAVVTCGGARFTVLTPELIRIEYSETAQFEDRATFTIVNRNLDVPSYMTADVVVTSVDGALVCKGRVDRSQPFTSHRLTHGVYLVTVSTQCKRVLL